MFGDLYLDLLTLHQRAPRTHTTQSLCSCEPALLALSPLPSRPSLPMVSVRSPATFLASGTCLSLGS